MLEKIISGGQTGADYGGLLAAEELGIETGGYCPRYCRTDEGHNNELVTRFGLVETTSSGYSMRTLCNVLNSDGTVIMGNHNSPGCCLTKRFCRENFKPYTLLSTNDIERDTMLLAAFIVNENIKTLNIAGNRERTNTGIEQRVKSIVTSSLQLLGNQTELFN